MKPNVLKYPHLTRWALIPLLLFLAHQSWSQCNNGSPFATVTAPTGSGVETITTCAFGGEYSTINGATAGTTYQFTGSGGTGNYLTVRQGTPGGAVLAFGFSPISATVTVSGPIYLHVNTTAGCGTDVTCHTTTIQCTSCGGGGGPANDLCTNALPLACGQTVSGTTVGSTIDAVPTCITTFGTSGGVWYSFVGDGASTTLSMCGSGYDTKIGVFTGSCGSPICVTGNDDFCGLQSQVTFTSTVGQTYWVLVTGFSTSTGSFNLTRTCVSIGCQNSSQFPSTTVSITPTNSTGSVQTITTCNFANEYHVLTNVLSGTNYTSTSSVPTDWLTVRVGSAGGPVLAQGTTPLSYTTTSTSDLYVHINTNSSCGTSTACRTTTVQCTNCSTTPLCVPSPTFPLNNSTLCPNNVITLTWPASVGATSYDVYFGNTPVPVFVGNTVANSFNAGFQTTGQRWWQIRPRNASGPAPGCAIWTFNLVDATAPTITCPANVVANNSPATACSAVVTYGAISATDNCAAPTITLIGGLPSGSTFPVGINVITYRATDGVGLSTTCTFTVTVNDATLPNITCPANIVKNNDAGLCGSTTTYTTPIATDNCGISSVSLLSGQLSGTFFPVGVTTNTWQAKDLSNNVRTCSFTVTVNDTEKPKITCPADILIGNDYGDCSAALPYLGTPIISDNCALLLLANNSPGTFQVGSTTVTWIINDNHSNTASCTQNVTIEDREFPVVTCPSNINVRTDEGDCVATVGYSANATDNCAGVVLEYSISPLSTFDIGLSNVAVTATDAAGNSVDCYFQISVSRRLEVCNDFDDDCDGLTDEAEDWVKIAKQYGADTDDLDEYGISVDIDGDYAIVGSNQKNAGGQNVGAAYILFRDKNGANAWGQIAKLDAPDLQTGDNFGASVSISGGVAAVGSPQDDNQIGNEGSILIFYQSPGNPAVWTYQTKITVFDADSGDNLGASVALDGDRLVAGANLSDDSNANAGAAYIFDRNQGGADNWGQVAKLLASTGDANDNFGVSVAIDGDYAVIGANGVDGFLQDVGAAYVFGRNQFGPDAWGQVAKIEANTPGQNDNFGGSVAISGPWILVGADLNDQKGLDAGIVYAFYQNNNGISNSWGQRNILQDYNGKAGDRYGSSVAIDGEYAVVGAKGVDDFAGDDAGAGFVYLRMDNGWVLVGNLEDGNGQAGDGLGSCAALSGRTAILGAPLDDAPGSNQGSALVFGGLCQTEGRPDTRDNPSAATAASLQCFPVPFSSVLNIEVKGIMAADAQVVVLNTLGQTVATLYNGAMDGDMSFYWRPSQAAAGVYFLRVMAAGKILTQTIVLER